MFTHGENRTASEAAVPKTFFQRKLPSCRIAQKPQEASGTISYGEALATTLLHATVYMFLHNLLNVLVQIANKIGFQKNLIG
jgi:hypothetical protein